jgi:hypothetical protein
MTMGDGMDTPLVRRRAAVLGKGLSMQILGYLSSSPYSMASEIAGHFDIHIATAAKHLSEMEKARLVSHRMRQTGRRPAKEYFLLSDTIKMEVDFSKVAGNQEGPGLPGERIRERANENVAYDWDPERPIIKEIITLGGDGDRKKAERILLDEVEGRFLWHVPFPGGEPRTPTEIAEEAGIGKGDLSRIHLFLDRLLDVGIVEKEKGG